MPVAIFTKQHYKAIANIIKARINACSTLSEQTQVACRYSCFVIANNLSSYFQEDNPKFDRDKFLKACGIIT